MRNIFDNFHYEPSGAITLKDAVCRFLQEEIAFDRIHGGDRLPTIKEISEATGLTYGKARGVVERLKKEGYVHSRPYLGTVVLSRGENVLRGRVLLVLPALDVCQYHPGLVADMLGRTITAAGYAFSIATFSLDENDKLSFLNDELLRATDLVIAVHAPRNVQKCLAESGLNHIFVYGEMPECSDRPWIRFAPETAISHFAEHCEKAGVTHVTQVRFESRNRETADAEAALAERGIKSSWMTIPRGDVDKIRFNDAASCACEAFAAMPRSQINGVFLFWNSFIAQGAIMAFLDRGIRLPEDVKVVTLSSSGSGPVYTKSFTRLEIDIARAGEEIAKFALSVLAEGRIPRPPIITPQYVFGATFPFMPGC